MIIKKISSFVASIIILFIFIFYCKPNSKSEDNNIKLYSKDEGVLSIMYHRFNESKYPSTNIQMDIFKEHISIIRQSNLKFYDPKNLENNFSTIKKEKKILLTIDDAFTSFYKVAWPYLKQEKIPFILFVSTQSIGKYGYMTWEQIKELEQEPFAYIGNHAHSHDYLVDFNKEDFMKDINSSTSIFNKNLGYNPIFFSYPFGEYSLEIKEYISKNFKYAFGQHSGVIDHNKDPFELPRFPINEKYGDLDRFKFLVNLYPLQYKSLYPEDKYVSDNNPPEFYVEFFDEQKNINNINCFSDEGNEWKQSNIDFNENKLRINFREKFLFRRGRINCSLNDDGLWRWFGVQFSVEQN